MAQLAFIGPMLAKAGSFIAANGSTIMSLASTAIGVAGDIRAGKAAEARGEYLAGQYKAAGDAELAASHRQAAEHKRHAAVAGSRALAVAAASGGDTLDPNIVNAIAGFEEEGDYAAKVALYGGKDRARTMRMQGDVAGWEGKQEKRAAYWKVGKTIMGGVGDLLKKKYSAGEDAPGSKKKNYAPTYDPNDDDSWMEKYGI